MLLVRLLFWSDHWKNSQSSCIDSLSYFTSRRFKKGARQVNRILHRIKRLRVPPLGASVLKPRLDLCVRHLERLSERGPLRRRQVLLPVETLLEFAHLQAREGRAWFLALRRSPILVRVSDAPCHCEGREGSCGIGGNTATSFCLWKKKSVLCPSCIRNSDD